MQRQIISTGNAPSSTLYSQGVKAGPHVLVSGLVGIDPATGKIDRRIFSDQAIYEDEMEKIFGRAWLMIGHESLVPEPDDYFHTYMGEDPVILTRDGTGRLHALLNMCRHRGNRVVRCDDGNAKRCCCNGRRSGKAEFRCDIEGVTAAKRACTTRS